MATVPPFFDPSKPTADEVVRQLKHFPSAPRVLPPLKRLLADGNSSMEAVIGFIRLDPGIAARVLQMGNSAYYSNGTPCYTIDQAVNRIGYGQILELVSYAVASQVLVRPLISYKLEADELWRNSVACALAAEIIASQTGVDHNIAYTTGLLHSVGQVAIDEWLYQQRPGAPVEFAGSLPREALDAERQVLGFHQGDAGAALLRLWEFPPAMTEPVRWQYSPRTTLGHQREACLLHAAKWLRTAVCHPGKLPPPVEITILQPLRLTHATLESWIPEVRHEMEAVGSLLQVEELPSTPVQFPGGTRAFAGTKA
jgi:HD-like signal output (HDOD) protein